MLRIVLTTAAAAALAWPALAGDDEGGEKAEADMAMFANTLQSTHADGSVTNWRFNADHTFSNDHGLSGSWTIDAEQMCLTWAGADGDETSCVSGGPDDPQVGDAWTVTNADGEEIAVTLVEGREAAPE